MKIYLDNCCFNRPFDDQTQLKIYLETKAKLFIQQKILLNKYQLVWSYILEYENAQNPYEMRKDAIIQWKEISSKSVVQNEAILKFAENLKDTGVKTKDALHLSCAVHAKSNYFITTDKKLLNLKLTEIKIRNPIDFIRERED